MKELYDFLADLNKLFNKVQEKLLEYSNMYKSLQQEIDVEAAKLKDMSEEEINDYV